MPPRLTISRDSYSKNRMFGDGTLDDPELRHPVQRLTAPVRLGLVGMLPEPPPRVGAPQLHETLRELVREEEVAEDLAVGWALALAGQAAEHCYVAERPPVESLVGLVGEPADRVGLG